MIFRWNPADHPRDLLGQFKSKLNSLNEDDMLILPDRTFVIKDRGDAVAYGNLDEYDLDPNKPPEHYLESEEFDDLDVGDFDRDAEKILEYAEKMDEDEHYSDTYIRASEAREPDIRKNSGEAQELMDDIRNLDVGELIEYEDLGIRIYRSTAEVYDDFPEDVHNRTLEELVEDKIDQWTGGYGIWEYDDEPLEADDFDSEEEWNHYRDNWEPAWSLDEMYKSMNLVLKHIIDMQDGNL